MFDYANLAATFFREYVGDGLTINGEVLTAENVFSDALPSRDWQGEPTLEFSEVETTPRHYIDGSSRDFITLAVLFRAKKRQTAFEFAVEARQTVLPELFAQLALENMVDDWASESSPIAPDVRNLEIGETFAVQISVKIIEKKFLFGL